MHPVFDQLVSLLDAHAATYRVLMHDAEGQSARVAEIRGTEPGQGAKAMLCTLKGQAGPYALAILPGDQKLDMKKLGAALGGKKAELVKAETAMELTGCRIGAIAPFVFDERIQLIVDPALTRRYDEIAFNAGRLDASMVLATRDYLAIAKPQLLDISQA
ncbi:YbaK/prolyl-tRNA synthetase associated domain-containing protein [Pseudomonas gingeri]|uniref:YbaK/prolyl-tRNA synthetase associated domain-containing protein n=1 Tax=Pseudomonas gingeri TaxID=117681 RepID=A0A7Y7YK94_9PSED|nr:YbaK/prolyl-tRNA synthetase associated domain-containing protein [Pseudomonas gingeri]NWA03470.1 YbaK/prolyl-tRNA synthetase associated domain-containing protein [Pseudomonas gingeri]NWA14328.1 YbaK/prolyl-tRNA synthetase associated domain-containing protein [Pseudomonas gingeri]NWA55054.1 YbaK/prolyl-tRNA synthetase associated domain-containing protein [Pseudomonas gingeri]NWA94778.1 YbaK/prolyl-tRNA synthetase associated domain-containing protein [Pseudomonas gingeri]NWB01434.1 YbaK/proly